MLKPYFRSGWVGLAAMLLIGVPAPAQTQTRLSLIEAVRQALTQRLELTAASEAAEAADGVALQASLRPNPTFFIQTENWRAWGDPSFALGRDLEFFAYAQQQIETAGKRRKRTDLAELQGDEARLARAVLGWRIEQQVAEAWWSALAAERRLDLLEESRGAVAELVRYHERRVELGAIAEIELIKVQVEEQRLAQSVAEALNLQEQSRLELAAAMGQPELSAGAVLDGDLKAELDREILAEDWRGRALEQRPDQALQRQRVEAARAALSLAEAQRRPDVTPYLGYKRAGPFNTVVGGLSIPLNVSDRNQGGIVEAAARVREEEALLRALAVRTEAEVRAALAAAERARARALQLEAGLLARARESYRISLAAFQEQGTDLLFLLDALRARNDAELLAVQALADYKLGVARLKIASGAWSEIELEARP